MREQAIRSLSTGELVRRLIDNLSSLVDREVDLVRQEARADAIRMAAGGATLGLGLLMLYTAFAALIAALIFAIAPPLTSWGAALVIALVFALLGAVVTAIGWSRVRFQPLERTRETVREDVEWARSQTISRAR